VSGQCFEFPVQYAGTDDRLVVFPGRPETKRWWLNLSEPAPVDVLLRGTWRRGRGALLHAGDDGYATALASYRTRWPRVLVADGSPLVHIRLGSAPHQ
jgi:hypothetical protein